ncbi:hypothetical protein CH333_02045 [candidate division WOR-3 bacterium JGI_Cruoil_03_44_89]|uniref:non-specific protein-tyrosine kinase n=1 Tax=candidate division WOR-3 bacterium JGI_Cruoil_03_44_89 TaxID=1973748 RepID=A0A235BXH5_UNCW3|nr:MAG: hypothetical protein CH333_02045 [candidate division WOR-3 bacterium JGI_Cruoil_03_44_89]
MEEEQVSFEDYLRIIYERKWIIIVAFFAVVISTAVFTYRQEPVYEATCTIMVESRKRQRDIFELVYPRWVNILNYSEILKSVAIAKSTIEKIAGSDLPISKTGNPVGVLRGGLSVTRVRDTDILEISVKGKTPQEASVLANTIAEVLIESELATGRKEYTEQRHFLEEQIPKVKERLEIIENNLKKFKEETGLIALSEETGQLTEKLFEFDRLRGQTESELEFQKTKLVSLEASLEETQRTLVEKISQVSSPYILELRRRLVELETTHSMYLVQGLPENNPKLVSLRKSIDETKAKLIEETNKIKDKELPTLDPLSFSQKLVDEIISLRTEITAGETRLNVIKNILKEYERRLQRVPGQELRLVGLEREREINASTYELLVQRYEEVKIAEAGKTSNVRVIDPARPPGRPISPKKRMNLTLAVVIGLIVGVGGAFVVDYMDNSIKTSKDIERYTGLSILGSVPIVKKKNDTPLLLLKGFPSRSALHEAYRGIRTSLQFINPDNPIRTFLVTSPLPREGKTTIALNLAVVLSQLGLKTMVLDADMRKPAVHKFLGIEGKSLAEFLAHGGDIESFILPTEIENVSVIISKETPPNPAELLSSNKMKKLLLDLKERFDVIIIDTPPVLSCTDATVLAPLTDGVLIAVQSHKTNRNALGRVRDVMESVRAKLIGVVLNAVPSGRGGYGYYHYYHYYHYYPEEEGKGN